MKKITSFYGTEPDTNEASGSNYSITAVLGNKEISVPITGDETFTTICPDCSATVTISYDDFINYAAKDLFGSNFFCEKCSKNRIAGRRPE